MTWARIGQAACTNDGGGDRATDVTDGIAIRSTCNRCGYACVETYLSSHYERSLRSGEVARSRHQPRSAGPSHRVEFTEWGSIIDPNLSPDGEVFSPVGTDLVGILHNTVARTDSRLDVFNDHLRSVRHIVTTVHGALARIRCNRASA